MMKRSLRDVGDFIFVSDTPRPCDAILIAGGSYPELGEHAAALSRMGCASLVVPSGKFSLDASEFSGAKTNRERYPGPYETESAFLRDVLEQNGVPSQSIVEEPEARTTIDNACKTRALLAGKGVTLSRALIVCKPFHARRALMSYEMAFPTTEFLVSPFSDPSITSDNWHASELGRERVLSELRKCGEHFEDAFDLIFAPGQE